MDEPKKKSQPGQIPKELSDAIYRSLKKGADEARKDGRMAIEQEIIKKLEAEKRRKIN